MTRPPNQPSAVRRDDLLLDRIGRGEPLSGWEPDEAQLLAAWRVDVVADLTTAPARPRLVAGGRRQVRPAVVGAILVGALVSAGGAAAASVGARYGGMLWSASHRSAPSHLRVAAAAAPAPAGLPWPATAALVPRLLQPSVADSAGTPPAGTATLARTVEPADDRPGSRQRRQRLADKPAARHRRPGLPRHHHKEPPSRLQAPDLRVVLLPPTAGGPPPADAPPLAASRTSGALHLPIGLQPAGRRHGADHPSADHPWADRRWVVCQGVDRRLRFPPAGVWTLTAPAGAWSLTAPAGAWSLTAPADDWTLTAPAGAWSLTAPAGAWTLTAPGGAGLCPPGGPVR